MQSPGWLAVPICLGILAAACERPEETAETAREELSVAAREDPGFGTDQPAQVIPVPDTVGGRTLTGNLVEMNNSGATGVVTITPVDGQSQVHLSLTGVQPTTEVIPTIHVGSCDAVGQTLEQLDPVQVEATGAATGVIMMDRELETFADGRHSVRIYPEQGFQAPPIACADLPLPAAPTAM